MSYQKNVFTRIINKEINVDILLEDEDTLCFKDINPQSEIHYLVVPKILCVDFLQFEQMASARQRASFWRTVAEAIIKLQLKDGYKLVSNSGEYGRQEVPHFHLHILG
jgi:histidine triad (HIT) family protein